jgi:hypothetical protein
MSKTTDSVEFNFTIIEHGNAEISNLIVPTEPIYKDTPFPVEYDVQNIGLDADIIWAHIKDEAGEVIPDSYWEQRLEGAEIHHAIFTHPGVASSGTYTRTIEAGHK